MTKPVGKTKDSGFQVGVRKTLPVRPVEVWDFITSKHAMTI